MKRTTFFMIEVAGPRCPLSRIPAPGDPEYARIARIADWKDTSRYYHRPGHWKPEALRKLAEKGGGVLVCAHSVARDSKGFIEMSRRDIYPTA